MSTEKELLVWSYDRLRVLGLQGTLRRGLDEIERLYSDDENFEFAPVKIEPKRYFLAAFHFSPPIDITVTKALPDSYNPDDTAIVLFSLDEPKSREILKEFIKRSGFLPNRLDVNFLMGLETELSILETSTYDGCVLLENRLKVDLDSIFGAVRYSNFLHRYKGKTDYEGKKIAVAKFGLPSNFI